MAEQLKIQTSVYLAQKMRSTAQANAASTAGTIDLTRFGMRPERPEEPPNAAAPAFNARSVQDPSIAFENEQDDKIKSERLDYDINRIKSQSNQGSLSRNFAFDGDERKPPQAVADKSQLQGAGTDYVAAKLRRKQATGEDKNDKTVDAEDLENADPHDQTHIHDYSRSFNIDDSQANLDAQAWNTEEKIQDKSNHKQ